jgi:hypothetical protein
VQVWESPPDETVPAMHFTHAKFKVNSPAMQLEGAHEVAPTLVVSRP